LRPLEKKTLKPSRFFNGNRPGLFYELLNNYFSNSISNIGIYVDGVVVSWSGSNEKKVKRCFCFVLFLFCRTVAAVMAPVRSVVALVLREGVLMAPRIADVC